MRGYRSWPHRRHFLDFSLSGLGAAALHGLLNGANQGSRADGAKPSPHPAARAKRAIHICLVGGLSQGRLISQLCTLRHARLSPHVWGSGLGLAAAVHLVAAHPAYPATTHEADPPWVEYDVADNPLRDEILLAPLRPVQGRIPVPDAPGLGVEPDRAALARFRPR